MFEFFCLKVWRPCNINADFSNYSTETSREPSNGSMIPVMKMRQCSQLSLQLIKPRLSKRAFAVRRSASCVSHFGHFTKRFCKSIFPAFSAITPPSRWFPCSFAYQKGSDDPAKRPRQPYRRAGNNKKPRRAASTGAPGLAGRSCLATCPARPEASQSDWDDDASQFISRWWLAGCRRCANAGGGPWPVPQRRQHRIAQPRSSS
jgi:hypothetical protein